MKIFTLIHEADPDHHALLIRSRTTITYLLPDGTQDTETSFAVKSLPLASFGPADVDELADALLKQTPLLDSKRRDLLIKTLRQLCGAEEGNGGDADIKLIGKYTEMLYDDLPAKVDASGKIAALARNQQYQATICQNDVLMAALSRTMREDGLKHMQLGQNITDVFHQLSGIQKFAAVLLTHKAPDSLIKIIELENKRYTVMYKDLAEKKKRIGTDAAKRQLYMGEYEGFKKLMVKQNLLLQTAIQTLINLIEVDSRQTGKATFFIKLDKLVQMLAQCVKRKPIDLDLLNATVHVLQNMSTQTGGLDAIARADIINPLMRITQDEVSGNIDPIMRLIYNLTFDPIILQQMHEREVMKGVETQFDALQQRYFKKFDADYDQADSFDVRIGKIARAAQKRPDDAEAMLMQQQLLLQVKLMQQLGGVTPEKAAEIVGVMCGFQKPQPELLQQVTQMTQNPLNAAEIAQAGLMDALTTQFESTKDEQLAKLFSNVTAALPMEMEVVDEKSGNKTSGKPNMVDQITRIANIALSTGNEKLQSEAIAMMANAPPKLIQKEQAQVISKMALQALGVTKNDAQQRINAVSVISSFLTKQQTVQMLSDDGALRELPSLLIQSLIQAQGNGENQFDANISQFGLDFTTMEVDLTIQVLMAILRCVTYKAIRGKILKQKNFLSLIVRFLYNQNQQQKQIITGESLNSASERSEASIPNSISSAAMGRNKGRVQSRIKRAPVQANDQNIFRSYESTPQARATQIIEAIADSILDVLLFTEPAAAEEIRMLKWKRYNWDFFSKQM